MTYSIWEQKKSIEQFCYTPWMIKNHSTATCRFIVLRTEKFTDPRIEVEAYSKVVGYLSDFGDSSFDVSPMYSGLHSWFWKNELTCMMSWLRTGRVTGPSRGVMVRSPLFRVWIGRIVRLSSRPTTCRTNSVVNSTNSVVNWTNSVVNSTKLSYPIDFSF